MARSGASLKKCDLVSLGSFSRLLPPKAGLAVEVVRRVLPGNPAVTVALR